MNNLNYEQIGPLSRAEAEANLASGDPERMATTLVALGLHDADWKWVQQQCLSFLSHSSELVVSAAILSLGHTARLNHSLDKDVVVPILRTLATDSRYTGKVGDVLDDIDMFVKHS